MIITGYEQNGFGGINFQDADGALLISDELENIQGYSLNNFMTKIAAFILSFFGWGMVCDIYIHGKNEYQMFWCDQSVFQGRKLEQLESQCSLFCHTFYEKAR